MKSITQEVAESVHRFENPKYGHRIFESFDALASEFSKTLSYLESLERSELFSLLEDIETRVLIDCQDPEGAAAICLLKRDLKKVIHAQSRMLDDKGQPVNGYKPARHC